MISNMQYGQLLLLKELDYTPSIGWQIDPFGLSATNARLFAEMGIKALFINRIDVHERSMRRAQRELEFVWQPYSLFSGREAQLMGHVFWHHYAPPSFFGIDVQEDRLMREPPQNETQWANFTRQLHDHF
jgi:hypothetical protein